MLLSEHENIPWEALSYLIGGVSYGGRVTDEWDRRCLHALLDRFFCPEALQPDYSFSPDKVIYSYYTGVQIYGGPESLSNDFKIWPITFQGSGPSGPILCSCENISL